MARVDCETRAIAMAHDRLAPESSIRFLLSKLPRASSTLEMFDDDKLGTHADHFAWMKKPVAVAEALLRPRAPI